MNLFACRGMERWKKWEMHNSDFPPITSTALLRQLPHLHNLICNSRSLDYGSIVANKSVREGLDEVRSYCTSWKIGDYSRLQKKLQHQLRKNCLRVFGSWPYSLRQLSADCHQHRRNAFPSPPEAVVWFSHSSTIQCLSSNLPTLFCFLSFLYNQNLPVMSTHAKSLWHLNISDSLQRSQNCRRNCAAGNSL